MGYIGGFLYTYLHRRIHSVYSIPIIVIFAAVGILEIWKKENIPSKISTYFFHLNLKPLIIVYTNTLIIYLRSIKLIEQQFVWIESFELL